MKMHENLNPVHSQQNLNHSGKIWIPDPDGPGITGTEYRKNTGVSTLAICIRRDCTIDDMINDNSK
jgi:hypothetical protein